MELLGQPVRHISFGEGTIRNISDRYITICFTQGEKKFLYPDAFFKFLKLKDTKKQKVLDERNRQRLKIEKAEKQKEQERLIRRRKIRTMKIGPNSQAVFHVELQQAEKIAERGWIQTGHYLSGASKGKPRIPRRLKPNSVCLITGLQKGEEERDRCILGAFAVREDFLGDLCQDGVIEWHEKHRILLTPETALPFWEYFEHDGQIPRWGKVPFKYFSNTIMQRILSELVTQSEDTQQEEDVNEFYRYFCRMNRLTAEKTEAEGQDEGDIVE
ncbi:MAG: hypothetical protein Q4F24_17200 [Eubacteriales bacterium]|nr:hypothetical protein [Eubacteriales bacterium]